MALDPLVYFQPGGLSYGFSLPDPPTADAVAEQLARITQAVNELAAMIPQASETPPERPREPMIRLAMLPWDPLGGNTSEGQLVVYRNGAWVAL